MSERHSAGMRCKITSFDSVKEKEKNARFTADTAIEIYHSSICSSQTNDHNDQAAQPRKSRRAVQSWNGIFNKTRIHQNILHLFSLFRIMHFLLLLRHTKKLGSYFSFWCKSIVIAQSDAYFYGVNKDCYYIEIQTSRI